MVYLRSDIRNVRLLLYLKIECQENPDVEFPMLQP